MRKPLIPFLQPFPRIHITALVKERPGQVRYTMLPQANYWLAPQRGDRRPVGSQDLLSSRPWLDCELDAPPNCARN
jgi:hypothetical protein